MPKVAPQIFPTDDRVARERGLRTASVLRARAAERGLPAGRQKLPAHAAQERERRAHLPVCPVPLHAATEKCPVPTTHSPRFTRRSNLTTIPRMLREASYVKENACWAPIFRHPANFRASFTRTYNQPLRRRFRNLGDLIRAQLLAAACGTPSWELEHCKIGQFRKPLLRNEAGFIAVTLPRMPI